MHFIRIWKGICTCKYKFWSCNIHAAVCLVQYQLPWFIETMEIDRMLIGCGECIVCIPVKWPWMFPVSPLKISGAPGNIQGNLPGMYLHLTLRWLRPMVMEGPIYELDWRNKRHSVFECDHAGTCPYVCEKSVLCCTQHDKPKTLVTLY